MFQIFTSDRGKHCKHREYIVASVVSTSQQPRFDFEYFLILVDFQGKYLCFDHLCLPEVVDHWKHHKDGVICRPCSEGGKPHGEVLPGKVGKYSYLLGVSLILEFSVLDFINMQKEKNTLQITLTFFFGLYGYFG